MPSDNIQTQFLVGFNPNDLFYYAAPPALQPNPETCANLDIYNPSWDTKCKIDVSSTGMPFKDFSNNCYVKQLCVNKDKSDKLMSLQKSHSGTDEKNVNTKELYNVEFAKTINLVVGIVGVGTLIFYNI